MDSVRSSGGGLCWRATRHGITDPRLIADDERGTWLRLRSPFAFSPFASSITAVLTDCQVGHDEAHPREQLSKVELHLGYHRRPLRTRSSKSLSTRNGTLDMNQL